MPTGYTDRLEKMNWNVEKWLKETCVRAFGVCARLRDDRFDLTENEIRENLKEPIFQRVAPVEPLKLNEEELYDKYLKEVFYAKQTIEERLELKRNVEKALSTVNKMKDLADDNDSNLVSNVLGFARDQLELISSDYDISYFTVLANRTFEEYKEKAQQSYEWALERYNKQLEEYQKGEDTTGIKTQVDRYDDYVKEITALSEELKKNDNNK